MRKTTTALLALLLLLGGVASPASAARAMPGSGPMCPFGQLGIYTGYYADTWPYCYNTAAFLGQCVNIGGGRDNTTNSMWLPEASPGVHDYHARLYSDPGCGGISIATVTTWNADWIRVCGWSTWNGVCGRPTASSIRFW